MFKYITIVFLILSLTACKTITENKAKAITSETLETLSKQLDTAESLGWIEDKEEDEYQYMLLHAHDLLTGSAIMLDSIYCAKAETKEACIVDITTRIENLLKEINNE